MFSFIFFAKYFYCFEYSPDIKKQTNTQTFAEKQELETISRVVNTSIMETKFKVHPVPEDRLCVIENWSNWQNVNLYL